MTFDSNMQLAEQVAVPELYDITAGGYVWRYTSYKTDLTFLTKLYRAAAIKRSGFTVDQQLGSSKVTVSVPFTDPMKNYLKATPLPSTKIQIYRAVENSLSDYALLFEGMVQQVSIANKVISADCAQTGKLVARLPHIVYQSYCNWTLFDCDCGLVAEDWAVAINSVTVSGANLVNPSFALYSAGYFSQGRIYYNGDFRFITSHSGSTVSLQIPFGNELVTGANVVAYPGCDGNPTTCQTKFNNFLLRHVSMPYIPSHNPVVWGFK